MFGRKKTKKMMGEFVAIPEDVDPVEYVRTHMGELEHAIVGEMQVGIAAGKFQMAVTCLLFGDPIVTGESMDDLAFDLDYPDLRLSIADAFRGLAERFETDPELIAGLGG